MQSDIKTIVTISLPEEMYPEYQRDVVAFKEKAEILMSKGCEIRFTKVDPEGHLQDPSETLK